MTPLEKLVQKAEETAEKKAGWDKMESQLRSLGISEVDFCFNCACWVQLVRSGEHYAPPKGFPRILGWRETASAALLSGNVQCAEVKCVVAERPLDTPKVASLVAERPLDTLKVAPPVSWWRRLFRRAPPVELSEGGVEPADLAGGPMPVNPALDPRLAVTAHTTQMIDAALMAAAESMPTTLGFVGDFRPDMTAWKTAPSTDVVPAPTVDWAALNEDQPLLPEAIEIRHTTQIGKVRYLLNCLPRFDVAALQELMEQGSMLQGQPAPTRKSESAVCDEDLRRVVELVEHANRYRELLVTLQGNLATFDYFGHRREQIDLATVPDMVEMAQDPGAAEVARGVLVKIAEQSAGAVQRAARQALLDLDKKRDASEGGDVP